jgi:hypothetical protein
VSAFPPLERPRHVGHLLEYVRTGCAVCALIANVTALSILLAR